MIWPGPTCDPRRRLEAIALSRTRGRKKKKVGLCLRSIYPGVIGPADAGSKKREKEKGGGKKKKGPLSISAFG